MFGFISMKSIYLRQQKFHNTPLQNYHSRSMTFAPHGRVNFGDFDAVHKINLQPTQQSVFVYSIPSCFISIRDSLVVKSSVDK